MSCVDNTRLLKKYLFVPATVKTKAANDFLLDKPEGKANTKKLTVYFNGVVALLQTREAAILVLMEFTWMTSQSSNLKWQPFISLRGTWKEKRTQYPHNMDNNWGSVLINTSPV